MPDDLLKRREKLQVAENKSNLGAIISLTENSRKNYILSVTKSKSKSKVPAKVAFEPSPEEVRIIEAAQSKHGIKKATDIVRMALRRLADIEGFELKAS